MTEQEAEAFAERLTRVWYIQLSPSAPTWNLGDVGFYFSGSIRETFYLTFALYDDGPMAELETEEDVVELLFEHGDVVACWTCPQEEELGSEVLEQFEAQWLETFRRGCWLSGCPIEATAHEKAEWAQGFSEAEIESWNLKM